jgi:hypothetical protein
MGCSNSPSICLITLWVQAGTAGQRPSSGLHCLGLQISYLMEANDFLGCMANPFLYSIKISPKP